MIETKPPRNWRALQSACAKILTECGLKTEVEKKLEIVRGKVSVDVFAKDPKSILPSTCIIECKHWNNRVPQSVVHSVRSVATDYGVSHAFIVSAAGFQKGAFEAARFTNVKLFSYDQFETFFEPIWTDAYLRPKLYSAVDPLIEYNEPINARIFRKADLLPKSAKEKFVALRKRYQVLAMTAALQSFRCVVPIENFSFKSAVMGSQTSFCSEWKRSLCRRVSVRIKDNTISSSFLGFILRCLQKGHRRV